MPKYLFSLGLLQIECIGRGIVAQNRPPERVAVSSLPVRAEDQERILIDVQRRVVAAVLGAPGAKIDEVLADTLYFEGHRLKDAGDDRESKKQRAFYNTIQRGMAGASDRVMTRFLEQIVTSYAEEISGTFDERIYGAVTRVGVPGIGLLLNAVSPKMLLSKFPDLQNFGDAVTIQGEVEKFRRLHELGTVILVPTHVSNLDSIICGYALYQMGVPPFIYGAGLNLFSNPLIGFFLNNLGAYTVDRRKRDPTYKQVLKSYAACTIENGYDNIFFPGGTRSRSGAVERRLKLGLLGTGVSAYVNNLQKQKKSPNIYIVPASLNFQLVLEAETLIDDFLKDVGKSRYIITDDEFSQPTKVLKFMRQILTLDSKLYFTLGQAYDPFGNKVDDEGRSVDPCGRTIDPSRYVMRAGQPIHDAQRDAEYTRELGKELSDAYARDNVIQSTNVVARAIFSMLRMKNRDLHIMRLLRAGGKHEDVSLIALYAEMDRLLSELRALEARGGIRLDAIVKAGSADEVVADALRHFAIFHGRPAAKRRGDRVFAIDRQLLFYYQNRLEGYRLDRGIGLEPVLTQDHRGLARSS